MSWFMLLGVAAFLVIGAAFVVIYVMLGKGKDE
jgi:hypothetical protein